MPPTPPAPGWGPPPAGWMPPPPAPAPRRPAPLVPLTVPPRRTRIVQIATHLAAATGVRLLLVAVIAAGGALVAIVDGDDHRYPKAWDPRVAPLAEFVAIERGLAFDHPVYVDFLPETSFRDFVADGPAPMSVAEQRANEQQAAYLRALGLVSGSYDPTATGREMRGDGTLALYDDHTKRITVRGTVLDAPTRATLVHELTHALQDQNFDLAKRTASLADDQLDAFHALIEGDAERISFRYVDEMSEDDQDAIVASHTDEAMDDVYGDYPPAIVALLIAPYALGQPYVSLLEELGGFGAIDDAIRNPPHGSEYLLSPLDVLDGAEPRDVPTPDLLAGEMVAFDAGTLGPVVWYLVLAERLGQQAALAAIDGWAGDAYVAYEQGSVNGTVCVRAALAADDAATYTTLAKTLEAWAHAMPPGAVVVNPVDDVVRVQACDPGGSATLAASPDAGLDALLLPATRSQIALAYARNGAPEPVARCVADDLTRTLPVATFASDDVDDATLARIEAIVARCSG